MHGDPRSVVVSSRPDLTLKSPLGDRTIARTYRTSLAEDSVAGDGMFGKGWRANFEYQIGTLPVAFGTMLFDAQGRKILYRQDGVGSTVFRSPDGNGGTITRNADGTYLWRDAKGTSYDFSAAGKILSITDIDGNRETIVYDAESKIVKLIDRHGREVTFDYDGTNHVRRLLGPQIDANPGGCMPRTPTRVAT